MKKYERIISVLLGGFGFGFDLHQTINSDSN